MLSCGVLWSKESAATNALEMNHKNGSFAFSCCLLSVWCVCVSVASREGRGSVVSCVSLQCWLHFKLLFQHYMESISNPTPFKKNETTWVLQILMYLQYMNKSWQDIAGQGGLWWRNNLIYLINRNFPSQQIIY